MLDVWKETHIHKVVKNINAGRFIGNFFVMEVSDVITGDVLYYSIDKLVNFGIIKQPTHTVHNRRRFDTLEAAITHLKAGIECLKK